MRVSRSKWYLPVFGVVLGLMMLGAQWIGGHLGDGLVSLGIMVAFSVALLFGGRSETIRGLRGDGRDERFGQIDIHATALAGTAVMSRSSSPSWWRWPAGSAASHTPGSAPSGA
ncbi:MAG: hypothetical protein M3018_03500 [Actinomycetota bacterium]|nr:hypothetical protein [Actinomycetota bacterium]